VASASREDDDLESVLIAADELMYQVKHAGKAGIAVASGFSAGS
jgi:PleD family two-component response regulator